MKKQIFKLLTSTVIIFGFSNAFVSCTKAQNTPAAPTNVAAVPPAGYKLIWADEFNGSSVDATKWNIDNGNPHVNNEKEYYQAANAKVENGNLVITAKQENKEGQLYTSAKLNSMGKFSVQYGRVEARIKLPVVQGSWPAFWMLGNNISSVNWPKCGEIDIMEQVNTNNDVLGTMHWDSGNGHTQYGSKTSTTPGDYHIYAVEWDKNSIRWYVDNTLYVTGNIAGNINNTGAFQLPFYIILNLAMGGDLPGNTVNNAALPANMYVDYVRVYQPK
jgi:beta-glucanase (GH16 family)